MRAFTTALLLPFALLTAGCFLQAEEEGTSATEKLFDAEIATVGMDHISGSPIVLLREVEGGRAIPIWIGLTEAQAILQALHNIATSRPMTHDLAVQLLATADARLEEMVVHDMRDGIFYGRLQVRLSGADETVEVDCRPSDGLALAVRTGARIRVAEKILMDAPDFDFVPPDSSDQVVQVLGLTVVAASEALREELGLADDRVGLVITGVQDKALDLGFRRGDFILKINERVPETPMDFLEEVMRTEPGKKAEVHLLREDEEIKLELPTAAAEPERTIPI